MKRSWNKILYVLLLIMITAGPAFSQYYPKKTTRKLYYTYLGATTGFGLNNITYYDWNDDESKRTREQAQGFFVSGGAILTVIVENFQGDSTLQFMYNANDNFPLYHMFYSLTGRYIFNMTKSLAISTGPGIWFESQPSNKSYTGSAGLQFPIGLSVKTSEKALLLIDLFGRYGKYGLTDDESRKFSYGLKVSYMFKVGRI